MDQSRAQHQIGRAVETRELLVVIIIVCSIPVPVRYFETVVVLLRPKGGRCQGPSNGERRRRDGARLVVAVIRRKVGRANAVRGARVDGARAGDDGKVGPRRKRRQRRRKRRRRRQRRRRRPPRRRRRRPRVRAHSPAGKGDHAVWRPLDRPLTQDNIERSVIS